MKRILIAVLLFAGVAGVVGAQTISPISQDFGKGKASSDVTITNDGLQTISVSFWVATFTVENGQKISKTLAETPGVTVKLSTTSLKIPPKQSRVVSYDAKCPAGCNVEIRARMSGLGMRVQNGMLLVLELGSLAYIAPQGNNGHDQRAKVLLAGGYKDN